MNELEKYKINQEFNGFNITMDDDTANIILNKFIDNKLNITEYNMTSEINKFNMPIFNYNNDYRPTKTIHIFASIELWDKHKNFKVDDTIPYDGFFCKIIIQEHYKNKDYVDDNERIYYLIPIDKIDLIDNFCEEITFNIMTYMDKNKIKNQEFVCKYHPENISLIKNVVLPEIKQKYHYLFNAESAGLL